MRVLYHFPQSPFSRRTRMVLAEKGLEVELRDARSDAAVHAEAKRLSPGGTLPVLVDDDGFVLADSGAIAAYAEALVPEPRLFPRGEATRLVHVAMAACDAALTNFIDVATRYHTLADSPAYAEVAREMIGRGQRSLDHLGALVGDRETIDPGGFGVADIWATTTVSWLERLPSRRGESPNLDRLNALGWTVPPNLPAYAARHRERKSFPIG